MSSTTIKQDRLQIFICYSHADSRWFDPDSLISKLERAATIEDAELWYDTARLKAADVWIDRIEGAIRGSKIAILLLSPDFLHSPVIQQEELPLISKRFKQGELIVLPILVRECNYKKVEILSGRRNPEIRPSAKTPLEDLTKNSKEWDKAWETLAEDLQEQIKEAKIPKRALKLTVVGGNGGGSYETGVQVAITANPPPAGKVFHRWIGPNIADPGSPDTTLTMPDSDATVTAVFKLDPPPPPPRLWWWLAVAAVILAAGVGIHQWLTKGQQATIEPPGTNAAMFFRITVDGGSGGGSYTQGATVELAAKAPPNGKVFDRWSGATFANESSARTTLTMPGSNTVVSAVFKVSVQSFTLAVTDGAGSGSYRAGSSVQVTANPAPDGKKFDRWIGETVVDPSAPNTTLVMPSANTQVSATYRIDQSKGIDPLPPTTNFAEKVAAAKKWLTDMPKDSELKTRVQNAIKATTPEIAGGGYGGPQYANDKNSGQIWRPLHDFSKGGEVPYLCLIVMESASGEGLAEWQKDWKAPWTAYTFLKYSFRTAEGRLYATNAFPIVVAFSASGGIVQRAALETIMEVPVHPTLKWEGLHYAMEQCSAVYLEAMVAPFVQFGRIERREDTRRILVKLLETANAAGIRAVLQKLPEVTSESEQSETCLILLDRLSTAQDDVVSDFVLAIGRITPPDERKQAATRLLDVLVRTQTGNGASTIVGTLREWNHKQAIPTLRKILETSDANKSMSLTRLLADWKDKDSAKDIRAVIERHRYGDSSYNLNQFILDLYALEGGDCARYIAEVLLSSSLYTQKMLLNNIYGSLRRIRDKHVIDAIRKLADSSPDPDVQKLAAEIVK